MRNEKKIAYQEQQIRELKIQVSELKQENLSLSSQLDINKNVILSTNNILNKKENYLHSLIEEYKEMILQTKELQKEMIEKIDCMNKDKKKYIKKMRNHISRIKKQK